MIIGVYTSSNPLESLHDGAEESESRAFLVLLLFARGTEDGLDFDFEWLDLERNEKCLSSSSEEDKTMVVLFPITADAKP